MENQKRDGSVDVYMFSQSAMNESDAPQKTLSEIIEAAISTESVQSNKIVHSNVPGNCRAVIKYEITKLLNINSLRRFQEKRGANIYL